MNKTFVIIKPDAIDRSLVGRIIGRFEDMGLRIARIEKRRKNTYWCRQHYSHIIGTGQYEKIYSNLEISMVCDFTIGIVLTGEHTIERIRRMVGATNALEAEPGTIRGDWGKFSGPFNLVHASDSVETVEKEIALYFDKETDQ